MISFFWSCYFGFSISLRRLLLLVCAYVRIRYTYVLFCLFLTLIFVFLLLKIRSKKNHFSETHIKSSESDKSYQMKLNLYLQNRYLTKSPIARFSVLQMMMMLLFSSERKILILDFILTCLADCYYGSWKAINSNMHREVKQYSRLKALLLDLNLFTLANRCF